MNAGGVGALEGLFKLGPGLRVVSHLLLSNVIAFLIPCESVRGPVVGELSSQAAAFL